MLSFWEKREFTQWDHLIIGGGIVGLSTAASLLEAQPGAKVVVLERGSLPTGASTKNAGFACFGSLTELAVDRSQLPDEEVLQLVESRWNGLKRLRSRLGETALRYEACGGYEMITEAELSYLDQLEAVNELLSPLFGEQVFSMADEKIGAFGFDRKEVPHLISNPFEGQLDPAAMIHALWRYVIERGGTVLTGCEVMGWEEGPKGCQVRARVQAQPEQLAFHAQQLAICTNAFTTALLPDLELQPGRGQVLITEPIPDWPLRGVFHYQEGYYYFRRVGDRLLLGGGRNLDKSGEATTEFSTTDPIQTALEKLLKRIILPDRDVKIAHRWAGIMAFGPNKSPLGKRLNERVVLGVRLGGMGVAIGSEWGDRLANLMLSTA